jgi:hypothetical protein
MSPLATSHRAVVTLGLAVVGTATIGAGAAFQRHDESTARPYASQCTIGSQIVSYYDLNGDPHEVARTPEVSTWCP